METVQQVIDFLGKYDRYCIIGHREPDGDCIGSQLALASVLNRKGKRTELYSPGPFLRPEIADRAHLFKTAWEIPSDKNTAIIIVDCSTLDRIDQFAEHSGDYPLLVIDHHSSGREFGNIRYIDPSFPSVTLMIYSIMKEMGEKPTPDEAELLYFGFSTDTGFFRHLENTGGAFLKLAAELVELGASPKKTFLEMYGHRSFYSRKLIGTVLSRIESCENGRVIIACLTRQDVHDNNDEQLESDTLYQLLQGIAGSEVIVLLREENDNGLLSVGLRSLEKIDVGRVAAEYGGGGHARAAGFSLHSTIEKARSMVLDRLRPLLWNGS
ncbi:MAG: bifunctional oligoribonuclease/PAP phosphatase NrnA [Spirochaetales bacterium]|nr:bifunctional oligoribonuclease/PAP phosphatase NrnA [Spirochaetales bacterium]